MAVAKDGTPKILQECDLPLTGPRCVSTIITDLVCPFSTRITHRSADRRPQCVFDVDRKAGKLILTELAPGVTIEEVREKTPAKFEESPNLKKMQGV